MTRARKKPAYSANAVATAIGDGLQVRAGAEGPLGAGEDRDAAFRVGVESAKGIGQSLRGGAVHRIPHLRTLDRDPGDGAIVPHVDRAHAAAPYPMG